MGIFIGYIYTVMHVHVIHKLFTALCLCHALLSVFLHLPQLKCHLSKSTLLFIKQVSLSFLSE